MQTTKDMLWILLPWNGHPMQIHLFTYLEKTYRKSINIKSHAYHIIRGVFISAKVPWNLVNDSTSQEEWLCVHLYGVTWNTILAIHPLSVKLCLLFSPRMLCMQSPTLFSSHPLPCLFCKNTRHVLLNNRSKS